MDKILVVDDDRDILDVVSMLLKRNNYNVMTLSRGTFISGSIQTFSPDLILLDVALAGEDGRDICLKLKKTEETKNIPVILFSAHYDLVNNIGECMADGLVTKPFEVPYLLETIRKNIKGNNNVSSPT
ncbi:MAG: response regulator [Ginsengibacter sp.]